MNKREELTNQLMETMQAMKRGMHAYQQAHAQDYPLSHAQAELLFTIRHSQPVSAKDLAKKLNMTPGAISQFVEGIEQQGFLERRTSETDRRVQYLHISAKGEELIKRFEQQRHQMMKTIIHDLTDEELEVWLRFQQKMIAYFNAQTTEQ